MYYCFSSSLLPPIKIKICHAGLHCLRTKLLQLTSERDINMCLEAMSHYYAHLGVIFVINDANFYFRNLIFKLCPLRTDSIPWQSTIRSVSKYFIKTPIHAIPSYLNPNMTFHWKIACSFIFSTNTIFRVKNKLFVKKTTTVAKMKI